MSGNYKTIFQSVSEFAKFKWNAILQFSSKDSKRLTDDALKISLWYEPANTCEKKIRLLCQDEFTHLSFDKRIIINSHLYSNFELSVESNSELLWFCFLSFSDWFVRLQPLPQPIRFKTKTNRDMVTRVFPRFRQFASFHFEFSLALKVFSCLLIGGCRYSGFGFTTLNSNTALKKTIQVHWTWILNLAFECAVQTVAWPKTAKPLIVMFCYL